METSLAQPVWSDLATRGRLFSDVFEFSSDPLVVVDTSGRMSAVNAAMAKITGTPREQLIGGEFADCFSQAEQVHEILQRAFLEREVRDCEWTVVRKNGSMTEISCNVTLGRDTAGQVFGAFFVLRDITNLRRYEAQMVFQANYDHLTTLPNRRLFRDRLELAIPQARRNGRVLGVLYIDLDNFRDLNDTLGHAIGDEVLKTVARKLEASLDSTDVVARMGEDRFAVLTGDVDTGHVHCVDSLTRLVNRILNVVGQPSTIESHELVLSCSIGMTMYPPHDCGGETMLRNAEAAMYRAKDDGKNRFQLFTPEMQSAIRRQVDISDRLRGAMRKSEFMLHYQPRVEIASGKVTGVEALIRWPTKDYGMISPAEFIPVAERNGMIVPIGEWVLFEACRQARQWQLERRAPVHVAVNLSARQLRDVDVVELVVRALEETGLPAYLLELELTESMLVHDTRRVARTLAALKEIGVSLSIDDFGTGYSSLGYLKSFPLNYLKIDRSFVQDLAHDPNDGAIVRSIIGMAHSLGLKVIAEGVETRAQLDFLLGQDCDEMQGYFFSKPLPSGDLTRFLKKSKKLVL